jgi:hypothetical protein
MLQPLFSEDLTPYDFWLFPRQKMGLQSQCFATLKDIKCSVMAGLRTILIFCMTASKFAKTVGTSLFVQKGCT